MKLCIVTKSSNLILCSCKVKLVLCSCLIARNLLSGLKTCVEITSYMHAGGVSMPHGSIVAPSSIMDDKGKFDAEYTVRIIGFPVSIFFVLLHSCVLLCCLDCLLLISFGGAGRLDEDKLKNFMSNYRRAPTVQISYGFVIYQ